MALAQADLSTYLHLPFQFVTVVTQKNTKCYQICFTAYYGTVLSNTLAQTINICRHMDAHDLPLQIDGRKTGVNRDTIESV
jgi:hypothetical protein